MQIDGNLKSRAARPRAQAAAGRTRPDIYAERNGSFEDLYNQSRKFAFGGKIVDTEDPNGFPVILFILRPDQGEGDELDRYFSNITQMTVNSYEEFRTMHYTGRSIHGPYWCYHFRRPADALSLRELLQDHIEVDPVWLMKELLEQVNAFGRCRRHAANDHTGIREYTALSCLSLDTVFCSCRDQHLKNVTILPLRGLSGTYDYPDEMPREAGKEGASEKTDVYSVAYLGVEVASWTGTAFKIQGLPQGHEALLTRCLSPFPSLRPDARAFLNDLIDGRDEEAEEYVPEKKGHGFFSSLLTGIRESVSGLGGSAEYEDDPDMEEENEDRSGSNATFR